jgi:N-acetylmuramic acid 6-phosphate etherase
MDGSTHRRRAGEFLREAHLFQLGDLPTERPHPATRELSRWARQDLARAILVLKSVDLLALRSMEGRAAAIERLTRSVQATLAAGNRVFLCGCGATGRLSLSLEFLWRRAHPDSDQVVSFMAGGDVALVHSLEGFEDHPELGARHLTELGFGDGDLLVSCTEGGETPYVIGATRRAADLSSNRPFFLYCNPDSALIRSVERFRRVCDDPRIDKISLPVGSMALAGSTRMQASTALQLAVGLALLHPEKPVRSALSEFRSRARETDLSFLADFVKRESRLYALGHHVLYRVRDYGITVFTDTTERAPTFSLVPFDQLERPLDQHSLCYIVLDDADNATEAWVRLLNRAPRALNWPDVDERAAPGYLSGFDFSTRALGRLQTCLPGVRQRVFRIGRSGDAIRLRLGNLVHDLPANGLPELFRHLLLKQILNIHSTLVMGRLGRYEGNLMTWVQPTNGKLVDRAARHVKHLLSRAGRHEWSYEDIVHRLFAEMTGIRPDESIVLKTYRSLSRTDRRGAAFRKESA